MYLGLIVLFLCPIVIGFFAIRLFVRITKDQKYIIRNGKQAIAEISACKKSIFEKPRYFISFTTDKGEKVSQALEGLFIQQLLARKKKVLVHYLWQDGELFIAHDNFWLVDKERTIALFISVLMFFSLSIMFLEIVGVEIIVIVSIGMLVSTLFYLLMKRSKENKNRELNFSNKTKSLESVQNTASKGDETKK